MWSTVTSNLSAQLQGSRKVKGLKIWTIEAGKPEFEYWFSHKQVTELLNEAYNHTYHLSLFHDFSKVISSPTRLNRAPPLGPQGTHHTLTRLDCAGPFLFPAPVCPGHPEPEASGRTPLEEPGQLC